MLLPRYIGFPPLIIPQSGCIFVSENGIIPCGEQGHGKKAGGDHGETLRGRLFAEYACSLVNLISDGFRPSSSSQYVGDRAASRPFQT